MRNLRVVALWGIGVFSAMALGACATELQEPTSSAGPPDDLTSDLGSDTTSTSTSTSTSATTNSTHSAASTVSVTTGEANSTTETSTTGRFPLGGTITSSATVSTTSGSTTGGTTSAAATGTSGGTTNGGTTNGGTTTRGTTTRGTTNGAGGVGGVAEATTANTTTGGGACVGTTPATAPVALEPTDGWVDCSTNDIGIQGTFFTYEDGNGSTITSNFSGDEICVEGTAGQIVGGDNDTWGAGLGVNLHQDDAEADVETWNAGAMGISGFRFNLSAMPAGTGLRLVYQNAGTDYCVAVTAAGAQTVLFEDTAEACWNAGGDAPSGTMLEAVKWQVTTNATSDHDFAFCISGLAAVP